VPRAVPRVGHGAHAALPSPPTRRSGDLTPVPGEVVPSPQLMTAVKSLAVPPGLASLKWKSKALVTGAPSVATGGVSAPAVKGASVTVNDAAALREPGLTTVTLLLPSSDRTEEGTVTTSCVRPVEVGVKEVPPRSTVTPGSKLLPLMVRGKDPPPSWAVGGLSDAITGCWTSKAPMSSWPLTTRAKP